MSPGSGLSSTTSQATTFFGHYLAKQRQDLVPRQPAGSGVPVAGMIAGSSPSTSIVM